MTISGTARVKLIPMLSIWKKSWGRCAGQHHDAEPRQSRMRRHDIEEFGGWRRLRPLS